MRRLAKQTRNDGYSSKKDYQTLHEKKSQEIKPHALKPEITFYKEVTKSDGQANFLGFGGFVCSSEPTQLTIELCTNDKKISKTFKIDKVWSRIGLCFQTQDTKVNAIVKPSWRTKTPISIWGWEVDFLHLPEAILEENPTEADLNASHLSPETYYLPHEGPIDMDVDEENSSSFEINTGVDINLKKCSYCQRLLPVNPSVLGSLSFHKHNAKISNHQNECRSCKKWRINNSFNPLRTTDQLHESSVITRERKILLKEPEILQEIKDRTGAGLKSQVWERFDRKCFYCGTPVKLNEFQLDHTRPLAYLWPIDEHATCLCAEHNNQKKEKFPIDFYSEDQLKKLSEIIGLSYEDLTIKDVNQKELDRILSDICTFAKSWDARTFSAIARKIVELRPEVDLFEALKAKDEKIYEQLIIELEDRPDSVDVIEE